MGFTTFTSIAIDDFAAGWQLNTGPNGDLNILTYWSKIRQSPSALTAYTAKSTDGYWIALGGPDPEGRLKSDFSGPIDPDFYAQGVRGIDAPVGYGKTAAEAYEAARTAYGLTGTGDYLKGDAAIRKALIAAKLIDPMRGFP